MHDVSLRYLRRSPRGEPDSGPGRFCQCQQLRAPRPPMPPALPSAGAGRLSAAVPAATGAGEARDFTEHTLRIAFEVLNQKRPAEHLRGQLDPIPLASLRTLSRSPALPGRELGPARLESIGLQMLDGHIAEFFGCYRRGHRLLAYAGRAVRRTVRTPVSGTWVITAFRVC